MKMKFLRTVKYGSVLTVFLAMLAVVCHGQTIRISEIVADNGISLLDEDGDSSDWIELYNPSNQSVSVDGWYLTDDATALTQWSFPATNIAAKGFLVVFASDKNRSVAGSELHTNFKLSAASEYLALVHSDGSTVEDDLTPPALEKDVSFGYAFTDGEIDTSNTGLFTTPTPGSINTNIAYAGYVETPVTFPQRGFYNSPFLASVSNTTEGATVRYTLDGSEPTDGSTLYSGPITISATANLRVRAFKTGWKASYPRTDSYIFVDDVVTQPASQFYINGQIINLGMDAGVLNKTYQDASNQVFSVQDALKTIPTISITTDDANLYDPATGIYVNAEEHWECPASAELINPDGSKGFHINAGLRIRGGWSRHNYFPKHSFRLFFRNEYGEGKLDYPLFEDEGVTSFDKIDLRTAQNYSWAKGNETPWCNTFLRDVVCRDAAGAMGDAYTRSRYYHLYLNGLYWGLFMTEERPAADYGESYLGGDSDDYDVVKVSGYTDPSSILEATDGTLEAYHRLYTAATNGFVNNTDYFAVQGMNTQGEPDPSKEKLLDLNNLIDYVLLIDYAGASDNCISKFISDSSVNNIFAVYNRKNPDGFKWLQHDCEHAFDTSTDLDRTGPFTNSNFNLPEYFNAQTLHDRLSVNAEYRLAFADRVYKHFENEGTLVHTNMEALIDQRAAQIDRAILANAARWGSTSLDRDTWVNAVATTRAWFNGRAQTVIGYLDADGLIPSINPPQLSRSGGLVADGTTVGLTASQGSIYYTTDGSDPRAIGGAIAGTSYSGPFSITRPTHIKARAFNGSDWSALAEGTLWTSEIPLAFTEVMYHAPAGNPHDFIEIQNISDQPLTLNGYKLDHAINFDFKNGPTTLGPGDYMVVVDDLAAFSAIYPTNGIMIAGEFSGDLRNSGEQVDLEFRNNDLISFSYTDARNWPQAADGAGHSLVPLESATDEQESGSLDYGGNWRASTYTNGSPGFADPTPSATVLLNEITAHTDTELAPPFDSNDSIELYNPTASAIDLSGWGLSDDRDDLSQFIISNGTTIAAGGFVVFDENAFHTNRINGFGLNKSGEQVYLFDPARGVVDAIRFKGQENGVTLGRYPDGSNHWLATRPTLGSTNQPYDLPFRISELMYNPPAGSEMEYIVIENIEGASALLENTNGSYRIDGGVSYTFPAGVSLAAGEKIRLVSFNPAVDTVLLAQFRSLYGLSPTDPVYGPYTGNLSNSGERVALERPQASDDPLNLFDISWVVVDELYYFDQSPWPTSADGEGHPLVRTGLSSWDVPDTPLIGIAESSFYAREPFGQTPPDSTFEIWNSGCASLNYSISPDVAWISVSPSNGSSTGEHASVSLSYDTTGLAVGSHTGRVDITAAGVLYSPRQILVVLDLYEQQLDHFSWEPVATNQAAGQPFYVKLTARDQYGDAILSFNGSIPISAESGSTTEEVSIGANTSQWGYPISTYYHDGRTQVIYLSSELGDARAITSLALKVNVTPGQPLNNWTLRMRHSPLESYGPSPVWESDWTTVYQSDTNISSTGWTVFEFDSPFEYNGTDNLMIDFSHNNSTYTSDGQCASTDSGGIRSLYYRTDSGYGDPLSWSGTSSPTPNFSTMVPDIKLGSPLNNSVSISPTNTGYFVNGIWTGMLTVQELDTNIFLFADDGNSHVGNSNPFNVSATLDADGDEIPDAWEVDFFGLPSSCIATNDADHDGLNNLQEYITGMDPTNAASCFEIGMSKQPDGFIVNWDSVEGRFYDVLWTSDLGHDFQILASAIPFPVNSYTDRVHTASSAGFYGVAVRLPFIGDFDNDGLPDTWEMNYFLSLDQASPDWDFDGQSNLEEYIADTNPTNSASLFIVEDLSGSTLYWTAKPGRIYSIYWTDDLDQPFIPIATGLTTGSYTDNLHAGDSANFYRIQVELD